MSKLEKIQNEELENVNGGCGPTRKPRGAAVAATNKKSKGNEVEGSFKDTKKNVFSK